MVRHHIRRIALWALTALLLGLIAVPIAQQNVQKLATERGWDTWLTDAYPWLAHNMANLSEHWWFWITLGFVAGCVVWGWGSEWLYVRALPEKKNIVPPHLRLQFGISEAIPTATITENIWRWYTLKHVQTIIDPNRGQRISQSVVNVIVFIVFENRLSFKQIKIDYLGAPTHRYEVKDSGDGHAIIIFDGDLVGAAIDVQILV